MKMLNHFSAWFQDLRNHPSDYYLILTDDMDSYYSCRYLKKMFGLEIGGFYRFGKGLYLFPEYKDSAKDPVFIDCAVVRDGVMVFDNHRSLVTNHMSINPNLVTDRRSTKGYNRKYCGSTLMLLYALYGGELSELEKQFICAIDGFYIGYYKDNGKYRDINIEWLRELGIEETLLPVLEQYDMQFFIDLIAKYQLTEKIYMTTDNRLFTFADILPDEQLIQVMKTHCRKITKEELLASPLGDKTLFTAAETYNGYYIADYEGLEE